MDSMELQEASNDPQILLETRQVPSLHPFIMRCIEACDLFRDAHTEARALLLITLRTAVSIGLTPFKRRFATAVANDKRNLFDKQVSVVFRELLHPVSICEACLELELCDRKTAKRWVAELFVVDAAAAAAADNERVGPTLPATFDVAFLVNVHTLLRRDRVRTEDRCDIIRWKWITQHIYAGKRRVISAQRLRDIFPSLYVVDDMYETLEKNLHTRQKQAILDISLFAVLSQVSTATQTWRKVSKHANPTQIWHSILCVSLPSWHNVDRIIEPIYRAILERMMFCLDDDTLAEEGLSRRITEVLCTMQENRQENLEELTQNDYNIHELVAFMEPSVFGIQVLHTLGALLSDRYLDLVHGTAEVHPENLPLRPLSLQKRESIFLARIWHLLYACSFFGDGPEWQIHYTNFLRAVDPTYQLLKNVDAELKIKECWESVSEKTPCFWLLERASNQTQLTKSPAIFAIINKASLVRLLYWHAPTPSHDEWRYDIIKHGFKRTTDNAAAAAATLESDVPLFCCENFFRAYHYSESIVSRKRRIVGFVPNNPACIRDL
jgi:hypothetical protein